MKWIAELMKKCLPLKMEVVRVSNEELATVGVPNTEVVKGLAPELGSGMGRISLIIVCAEKPKAKLTEDLLSLVPADVQCIFFESMKRSTTMELGLILAQAGIPPMVTLNERHIALTLSGQNVPEIHDEIWGRVQEILLKDGYPTSWEISVNDEKIVYDAKIVKETIEHHNIRDTNISQDDQTDLHIMLEATKSVDEFMAMLEGKPFKKSRTRKRGDTTCT
jgi:hypothetical protein